MTEQEIEKLARKGWQDLHERSGAWRNPTGDEWEYYLQAWKDSISALYTEEDIKATWNAAASYYHGIRRFETADYNQWIEQLKQEKQQIS